MTFEIRCIGRVLLVRGSRLKNEENMRASLCFSSVIIFTTSFWNSESGQGTVSSLNSRLKNEVYIHVSQCLSSVFIFTDRFWNSVYWQSTVGFRLTL